MTYPKFYSIESRRIQADRGIILIDIALAFSLALIFVTLIAEVSQNADDLFRRARDRDMIMDEYDAGSATADQRPYGNERMETAETVNAGSWTQSSSTTEPDRDTVTFDRVAASAVENLTDTAGTPLCSVDFEARSSMPAITTIALGLDQRTPLSDLEVRNGIAYVSADSSSVAGPHVFIFDIRDPGHARLLSSAYSTAGVASIALVGPRVFAATRSTTGQLQSIFLRSPETPVLESKLAMPLPFATATPPVGSTIFFHAGYLYVGTDKWDGEEFDIIDAHVPTQLSKIGGFEIGSKVNDIYVSDDRAYVASADMDELRIIDVHDPSRPSLIAAFAPSGWQRQEAQTVSLFEGGLNLARTSGGYDIPTDPEVLSWATTSISALPGGHSLNVPGGVYGLVADRSHIFLAARQPGKELQIFDRALLPASLAAFSLPTQPQAMTCDNDKLYVISHTSPVIYQITFT